MRRIIVISSSISILSIFASAIASFASCRRRRFSSALMTARPLQRDFLDGLPLLPIVFCVLIRGHDPPNAPMRRLTRELLHDCICKPLNLSGNCLWPLAELHHKEPEDPKHEHRHGDGENICFCFHIHFYGPLDRYSTSSPYSGS